MIRPLTHLSSISQGRGEVSYKLIFWPLADFHKALTHFHMHIPVGERSYGAGWMKSVRGEDGTLRGEMLKIM